MANSSGSSSVIVEVQEDPDTGDLVIPLNEEILSAVGWSEGDRLSWKDLGNGQWSISKKEVQE
jgi:hypothetical protein